MSTAVTNLMPRWCLLCKGLTTYLWKVKSNFSAHFCCFMKLLCLSFDSDQEIWKQINRTPLQRYKTLFSIKSKLKSSHFQHNIYQIYSAVFYWTEEVHFLPSQRCVGGSQHCWRWDEATLLWKVRLLYYFITLAETYIFLLSIFMEVSKNAIEEINNKIYFKKM